ncbi:MAG: hypothetical protein ACRC2G_00615 [Aestuariivirga sp.]
MDLVNTPCPQLVRDERAGSRLLEADLWVSVNIPPNGCKFGVVSDNFGYQMHLMFRKNGSAAGIGPWADAGLTINLCVRP